MLTRPHASARRADRGVACIVPVLVAVLSLFLPRVARSQDGDDWLGRDKALHFSFSAAIAGAGYGGAALVTEDRRWRLAAGGGLAIAAGAGKESPTPTDSAIRRGRTSPGT